MGGRGGERGKMKDSWLLQYSPKSRGCKNKEEKIFLLLFFAKSTLQKTYCSYPTQLLINNGWSPSHQGNAAIPKVPLFNHTPPSLAIPGFCLDKMTLPTGVSRNIPPVRSVSEASAGHHTAHSAGEAPCLLLGLSWPRVPWKRRPSIHRCQLRRGRR